MLAEEGRISCGVPGSKIYKVESLVFVPLVPYDRMDPRLAMKLENFQKMLTSFGYYAIGRSVSSLLVDKSRMA